MSNRSGDPIAFHAGQAEADITSQDTRDRHTRGAEFKTRWVTLHDTDTDGTTPSRSSAATRPRSSRMPATACTRSAFKNGWRLFWTQQHGDNTTYEVSPAS